jgi:hypothetical protein
MCEIVMCVDGLSPIHNFMPDVFRAINEVLQGTGVYIKDVETNFSNEASVTVRGDTDLKTAENKVNEKYPDWGVRFGKPRTFVRASTYVSNY